MYRLKSAQGTPLLVSDCIIEDYKLNKVHTLHSKNLLHLGEDRYLTTLLLKHFPGKRLEFVTSAVCFTDIPATFQVLLSQRRRWINSTLHNLYEVMKLPKLCSFCFINLRTLILLDLVSTMILPITTLYLYTLLARMFLPSGVQQYGMVVAGVAGIYATHLVIIVFVKRQYEYVIWIVIYMLFSLPIFSIVLPLYAVRFHDFLLTSGAVLVLCGAKLMLN
jgi:chitin synthase